MIEVALLAEDPTFVRGDETHVQYSEVYLFSHKQEVKNRKNAQTLLLRHAVDRFVSLE